MARKKLDFSKKIKQAFFNSQVLPLVLTFTFIGVLFVLFRMKGIELDYRLGDLNNQIEKVSLNNKELKARKAKLLSVKKLKRMAKKHNMAQPEEQQIIVVP